MKRALVISGGGSRGAFAAGVLQQLRSNFPTLNFDLVVGTSTGAMITPFAALNELTLLEQLYTSQTTDRIITKHRLGDRADQPSIYTVEPLWQLLRTNVTDQRYRAILGSGKHIYLVTTCLQTGRSTVFTTNPAPKQSPQYQTLVLKDAEHMRLAILASACQPVFMTPVKVNANYSTGPDKDYQYVDGGVLENAGIRMAIDQDAQEIFCILLSSPDNAAPVQYTALLPMLERTIDLFTQDVLNNDVLLPQQVIDERNYIQAVKKRMLQDGIPSASIETYFKEDGRVPGPVISGTFRLFLIRPRKPLNGGPGGLVFDPVQMRQMVQQGRADAADFVATLDPSAVTWLT